MTNEKLFLLRNQIDEIDDQIAVLFVKRMSVVSEIAKEKKTTLSDTKDSVRENEILERMENLMPDDLKEYSSVLFMNILSLSRAYQDKLRGEI